MKKYLSLLLLLIFFSSTFAQMDTKSSNNSFLQSAAISVTIGGDFIITGTYPAMISERVDQFVTRMYNEAREKALRSITDPKLLDEINKKLEDYSLRDILLKRSDGTTEHLDLIKFRNTGDFKNNPYLKNDDVLIFSPVDFKHDFFTVSGAVNKPGKFPFVEGDKLQDALQLAMGVNKAYENVKKVEIDRLSYNGEKMEKNVVDINSDVPLKRGDRIIVLADESQRKDFSVTVLGEVNMPGKIPITKNNTNVREVLLAAGGITSDASLRRAKVVKASSLKAILEKQFGMSLEDETKYLTQIPNPLTFQYEKSRMMRMTTLTEKDTAMFSVDERIRELVDESAVNFDSVFSENSEVGNTIVRNGDIVVIPQKITTVYVFGQVVSVGAVPFIKGEDYKYYINKAGGLGELAKYDDIAIIKGNSRKWINVSENDNIIIEPGDFIYVPKDPNHSFDYYVYKIGGYLGIVSSVATIFLLLYQLTKN